MKKCYVFVWYYYINCCVVKVRAFRLWNHRGLNTEWWTKNSYFACCVLSFLPSFLWLLTLHSTNSRQETWSPYLLLNLRLSSSKMEMQANKSKQGNLIIEPKRREFLAFEVETKGSGVSIEVSMLSINLGERLMTEAFSCFKSLFRKSSSSLRQLQHNSDVWEFNMLEKLIQTMDTDAFPKNRINTVKPCYCSLFHKSWCTQNEMSVERFTFPTIKREIFE